MAASQKDQEIDLTCSICVEWFREPVILPCQHSFCRECIDTFFSHEKDQTGQEKCIKEGDQKIRCPLCRSPVEFGSTGLAGLPRNHKLVERVQKYREMLKTRESVPVCSMCEDDHSSPACHYCPVCHVLYCESCLSTFHPLRGPLKRHSLMDIHEYISHNRCNDEHNASKDSGSEVHNIPECRSHKQAYLLFCGTCDCLLCAECLGEHFDHQMRDIPTVYKQKKDELEKTISEATQVKEELRTVAEDMNKFLQDVEVEKAYQKTLGDLNTWKLNALTDLDKHRKKLCEGCLSSLRDLNMKTKGMELALTCSNKVILDPEITFIEGCQEAMPRITKYLSAMKGEAVRNRDLTKLWQITLTSDKVTPRQLIFKEEVGRLITRPELKFTIKLNNGVTISERGSIIISKKPFGNHFTGALTDGRLVNGRYYWELNLVWEFSEIREVGGVNLAPFIFSAGLVREGFSPKHRVGGYDHFVGEYLSSRDMQSMGKQIHQAGHSFFWKHQFSPSKGTIKHGFLLDSAERTLVIFDTVGNHILERFTDIDVSHRLVPVVAFMNTVDCRVTVKLVSGNRCALPRQVCEDLTNN